MKVTQRIFTLLIVVALTFFHFHSAVAQAKDSTKKKDPLFELSFGNTLLFIPDSKINSIHAQTSVVLPTSALLFFAEIRPTKIIRFPIFFNLPTESKQFIVDGQLVNEKANVTFGGGTEFRVFKVNVNEKTRLDLEIGPLASFIVDKHSVVRVAPIIAARLRLMKGENFVMYIGGSFSFGIDAAGLLYGTGTMF
jgi:hypothetical protein